jgi:Flp pilus assembly protein TadG
MSREFSVPAFRRCLDGIAHFRDDRRGVIVLKLALALPVVMMLIGSSIDHLRYIRMRAMLQSAVDAAALAAAKELSLTDTRYESLPSVAQAVVTRQIAVRGGDKGSAAPTVTTAVSNDPIEVEVNAEQKFDAAFGDVFSFKAGNVEARAVARVIGKPNICVLALNPQEGGAISLEQKAHVTGQNCAVYSNSAHNNGLKSKNNAILTATFICTRGGREGGPGNFNPDPLIDCPSFEDPLAGRPEPAVTACDPKKPVRIVTDTTLDPGTYCGLEILGGAKVTLRDGVFVFRDKPLIVKDGGAILAEGAGLFFTGDGAYFKFERRSTVSLKAPTAGPMAGLLVFASRAQSGSQTFEILSDDARVLLGTIYVPKGELRVDATSPVADQSAYTAIVADKMRLYGGPHLVLNTNYHQTDVPVPEGVKGVGQPVALAK